MASPQGKTVALLTLALMCENVNAAPQEPSGKSPGPVGNYGHKQNSPRGEPVRDVPAVAAPFTLAHPICQTGFLVAQRIDTRDRFGIIVKRQWVPGCARAPRIVYGRKV